MTVETATDITSISPNPNASHRATWTRKRGRKPIVLHDNRTNPLEARRLAGAHQRRMAAVSQHHGLLSSALTVGVFDSLSAEWDTELRRYGRRAVGIATRPGDAVRRARMGLHTTPGQIADFGRGDFPAINRFIYHNHTPDLLSEDLDGGGFDGLTPEAHRAIELIRRGQEMETYAYASPALARLAAPVFWLRSAATTPVPECKIVDTDMGPLPTISPIPRVILDAHISAEKVWHAAADLLGGYGYHCKVVPRWTPTCGSRTVLLARSAIDRGPLSVPGTFDEFDITALNEALSR